MTIKKAGVIGCGAMGSGIVQVLLQSGYEVTARETNQVLLDSGIQRINKAFEKLAAKGRIDASEKEAALGRLTGALSLEDLKDCDIVIEAVFEDIDVKVSLFSELDGLCKAETILASNTSSLSITEMAAAVSRKERVIGLHFFNPPALMPLVEVVHTISTGKEVLTTAVDFVKSLGKSPIIAKDNAGFIVNLLLTPFLMDAMRAFSNGVAGIEDIDTGIKLGLNHPLGPLKLADMIGLDILLSAGETMCEEYSDTRYAPPPILKKMVMMGYLGMKTKRGFYDWSDPKNPKPVEMYP